MTKAVVVTGSREFDARDLLNQAIHDATRLLDRPFLSVGDCPTGADELARIWWGIPKGSTKGLDYEVFEANWDRLGRYAGPERNKRMVDYSIEHFGVDDIEVLAFFKNGAGNRGTRNCVAAALAAGIPDNQVKRFWA